MGLLTAYTKAYQFRVGEVSDINESIPHLMVLYMLANNFKSSLQYQLNV